MIEINEPVIAKPVPSSSMGFTVFHHLLFLFVRTDPALPVDTGRRAPTGPKGHYGLSMVATHPSSS